jgi:hypothetical protein
MKKSKGSREFLEALRKIPIVQVACDKTNLSRNTVYRWKREDPTFAKEFEAAMRDGIEFVNDMSESQLFQLIKDRSFSAVRYWLNHHHPRFKLQIENKVSEHPEKYKLRMQKLREDVTRMNNEWFVPE